LIEFITFTPGPKRGEIAATLHGDLGTILEWTAQMQKNRCKWQFETTLSLT
jgi:hypothetical protein